MKPFNPELCPLVVVNRPEYFNGQRWQTLEAYEDNHVTQERRVFKLRVYLTASGKPSRTREHPLEVFTAYGYDDTRRTWGTTASGSHYYEQPFAEAVALMGTINKLAGKFDQYRGTATYYRSGKP